MLVPAIPLRRKRDTSSMGVRDRGRRALHRTHQGGPDVTIVRACWRRVGPTPDRDGPRPGKKWHLDRGRALARCGWGVPGRAIQGNPTNPEGFYEPRWVVDFHRRWLDQRHVGTTDTSPGARRTVAKAVSVHPDARAELREWLASQLAAQPRLVIKDPRGLWFHDVWVDVMRELDVEPGFVTMLRHPAEVSASRHKSYRDAEEPPTRDLQIRRTAGWINAVLTAEEMTRGSRRVCVRYSDLLADWRGALGRIAHQLDLRYEPAVGAAGHPVDDFIDPSLRSVHLDRAKNDLPGDLRVSQRRGLGDLLRDRNRRRRRSFARADRSPAAEVPPAHRRRGRADLRRQQPSTGTGKGTCVRQGTQGGPEAGTGDGRGAVPAAKAARSPRKAQALRRPISFIASYGA